MKKTFKRYNGNENQNDVLFFFTDDIPMMLNVELFDGIKYEICAIVHGEKRIYKNNNRVDLDIATDYNSDEELQKDIDDETLKIENSNWFELSIFYNNTEYLTEEIIYSLKELKELEDKEIYEMISKYVTKWEGDQI